MFYNGAGISESATKEQVDAYLEQTGQEELYTDFFVISMVKMNAFLEEKVGCFYGEILERGNMTMEDAYVSATGCFSLEVGDTNYTPFRVESGERTEDGRILLRESGTEPVIRVMVEAQSDELCAKYVDEMVQVIREEGLAVE